MEERFNEQGMWRIPERIEKLDSSPQNSKDLSFCEVFCQNGHNLARPEHPVSGQPGIVLAFTRPNGEKGRVAISSRLEDVSKQVLEGDLVHGERVTLSCPECGARLPVLSQCDRCHTGDMCLLYCSPALDINASVAFCNVVGCPNAMMIRSDRVIRAMERDAL